MSVLRNLEIKDAPFMLEWMHDENVNKGFQIDFASKTMEDCVSFIKNSQSDAENIHYAVVDSDDEYMGTVSLKEIDSKSRSAEFAIAMRTKAHGTGLAAKAMEEIIELGLYEKGLRSVYWNVLQSNVRAIRFYDKNSFLRSLPHTHTHTYIYGGRFFGTRPHAKTLREGRLSKKRKEHWESIPYSICELSA